MEKQFQHQVIKVHKIMTKKVIMKRFAFEDLVRAMSYAKLLNTQSGGGFYDYIVKTVQVKVKK